MRLLLFVLALTLPLGASAQSREAMIQQLADATSVTIRDHRISPNQAPRRTEITFSAAADIRAFAAVVRLSEVSIRGEKRIVDGEEVVDIPYCQCLPDFVVILRQGEKTTLEFSLNHWSHTRTGRGRTLVEYDFVPASIEALQKHLWRFFPTDEQIAKKEG